jgi:cytochrome c oxidase subunit II
VGNKFWSIVFGVTMAACLVGFAISPWMGWWMPDPVTPSGVEIDRLFYVILWITTFFFILTEVILVSFMWQYGSQEGKRPVMQTAEVVGFLKPLSNLLHNQHRVELAWTIVPAAILLYIAFAQVNTWANAKYESRKNAQQDTAKEGGALQIAVSARQFEWRMRYPSVERFKKWVDKANWEGSKNPIKADFDSFGRVPQADDVFVVNELHIWQNHQVVVHLSTRDVIHSFNLPNFRVKQDALPGKLIPVWFRTHKPDPDRPTTITHNTKWDETKQRYVDGISPHDGKHDMNYVYDIACAELCGWGHYRMIGRVYVHKDDKDFLEWLVKAEQYSRQRTGDR